MSALVIKEWQAEGRPIDSQNNYVSITGRKAGLIDWLLSWMGIDPTTTILVGVDRIEFSSGSLAGTESRHIPLQSVCSTYYGYHKPWKTAVFIFSLFFFSAGVFAPAIAGSGPSAGGFLVFLLMLIAGALTALIYYYLNRTLTLGFVEHSGFVNGIIFKRSVIENKDISHEQAKIVCIIVQRLIEKKEVRGQQKSI